MCNEAGGPDVLLVTNEGADHPAHKCSLIVAFVIRSLDRISSLTKDRLPKYIEA